MVVVIIIIYHQVFSLLYQTASCVQVELAALEYRSSRLVRVLDKATGQRLGFGEGGATEVVSARYACHACLSLC